MKIILVICAALSLLLVGVSAGASQKPLPNVVLSVSEDAEDVVDLFLKNDWADAQTLVNNISKNEADIESEMNRNHMPHSCADEFNYFVFRLKELARKKQQPVMASLAANQITALLIDLQDHYTYIVPLEISRMDYLGREIILLARMPDNYGLLDKRISQLRQMWDTFKPDVKRRNGDKIAAQVDHVIGDFQKSASQEQMTNAGSRILDLVDRLETLFTEHPGG